MYIPLYIKNIYIPLINISFHSFVSKKMKISNYQMHIFNKYIKPLILKAMGHHLQKKTIIFIAGNIISSMERE